MSSNVMEKAYLGALNNLFEAKASKKAKAAKKKGKLAEDAVVAAAPAGGGEIAAPTDSGATDIQAPGSGIKYDDVLGKCDHQHDGYLGPGCFHVPKRVGKLMRRIELPGKKKKGHKNPYVAKMKVMTDAEIDTIDSLSYDDMVQFLRSNYMYAKNGICIDSVAYSAKEKALVFKAHYFAGKALKMSENFYMLGTFDGKTLSAEKYKKVGMMSAQQAKSMFANDTLTVIYTNKKEG